MPFPSETHELGPHNLIDDVRGFLEAQYRDKYYVYNLSHRTYDVRKFNQRVSPLFQFIAFVNVASIQAFGKCIYGVLNYAGY